MQDQSQTATMIKIYSRQHKYEDGSVAYHLKTNADFNRTFNGASLYINLTLFITNANAAWSQIKPWKVPPPLPFAISEQQTFV